MPSRVPCSLSRNDALISYVQPDAQTSEGKIGIMGVAGAGCLLARRSASSGSGVISAAARLIRSQTVWLGIGRARSPSKMAAVTDPPTRICPSFIRLSVFEEARQYFTYTVLKSL